MTDPGIDGYSGFEPQVGQVRAVRTFRIGPQGRLHSLLTDTAWSPGTNTARCQPQPPDRPGLHTAPSPNCTCGLYCYASEAAAAEHPNSRHVVAVVTCWRRIIAGTRGVRAEHARVEALWMSPKVPPNLAPRVVSRYPCASTYERRSEIFAAHPPTKLGCYESAAMHGRAFTRHGLQVAVAIALVLGALSPDWLGSHPNVRLVWAAELGFFCVGAAALASKGSDVTVKRRMLLFVAVALWLIAPFAGSVGRILLRFPLVQVAALGVVRRARWSRRGSRFPAEIGETGS
jgi:hypothetical protein